MLFKIYHNPKHPLYLDLPGLFLPAQITRGALSYSKFTFCSDRILTCRIKSIRSPAKVGLVVTDLITSPVVSWEGWETPPPAPRLSCHSLLNHRRGKTSLLLW